VIHETGRVGFGEGPKSYYKLGYWTPIEIVVQGGKKPVAAHFSLAVPDGDGVHAEVLRDEQISPLETRVVRFLAPVGREEPALRARCAWETTSGETGVAEQNVVDRDDTTQSEVLDPGQPLYLVLGPPVGIEESVKALKSRWQEGRAPHVVTLATTRQLPTRWYGYQSVDVLILSTGRPELYQAMTDAQKDAMSEWVRMGGRLVISAGAASRPLLIEGGQLHEYTPGKLENFQELNRGNGFDEFAEKLGGKLSSRLISKADTKISVPFLKNVEGAVLAKDFDLPLIVRTAHGFGEVTFLAADLDSRLFLEWADGPKRRAISPPKPASPAIA
jgi:hypothetical protein